VNNDISKYLLKDNFKVFMSVSALSQEAEEVKIVIAENSFSNDIVDMQFKIIFVVQHNVTKANIHVD